MLCEQCNVLWPYRSGAATCMTCGKKLRLTADDLLGDTPARIVSEVRPAQVGFAKVLEQGIRENKHVTAEAGTGTGKSFAVLLPAILSGKRVAVSTATTLLQSQYIEKDLPFLERELARFGIEFSYALAKGKSHYLCSKALEEQKKKGLKVPGDFEKWAANTAFGDRNELGEDCPDWFWKVCAEDCPGTRYCLKAEHCGYAGARALVSSAQIIIANHSLIGLNTQLNGMLLPRYDLVIFDEAHKVSDYFRSAFAATLGEGRVSRIASNMVQGDLFDKDAVHDIMKHLGPGYLWDDAACADALSSVEKLQAENAALFQRFRPDGKKAQQAFAPEAVREAVDSMQVSILAILDHLLGLADFRYGTPKGKRTAFFACANEKAVHPTALVAVKKLDSLAGTLATLATEDPEDPYVRYVEFPFRPTQVRKLSAEPIDLAPRLQRVLFPSCQVIATSATLTVSDDFSFFHKELGFPEGTLTHQVASPFDYANRSLVYLTRRVPVHPYRDKKLDKSNPRAFGEALENYTDRMVEEICELLRASGGAALVLFSSRKEMEKTVEGVREELGEKYPIMEQREGIAASVIEAWFRGTPNGVLFGLKSFWEGVDFQGDMLRMVIVTKAPFPHQDDLIHKAQRERMEATLGNGYQAFLALDVPKMVMDVKQAAGRLIRTMNDYGVVAILDRTLSAGMYSGGKYPRRLGRSLPFTRVSTSIKEVRAFLSKF